MIKYKVKFNIISRSFSDAGYTLLSNAVDYKNCSTKLNYICPKGHEHSMSWRKWKMGRRCHYCGGSMKHSLDFIKESFERDGYILLSNFYIGAHSKLKYICPEGHEHTIAWTDWQQGQRCAHCAGKTKLTIAGIRHQFEAEGYSLLSEIYLNARKKLKYICPLGHEHEIVWYSWKNGNRCPTCRYIKQTGPGHPMWKGGISCEPYCQDWTKAYKEYIKERDGNTCLNPYCYKNDKRLHIHHINYIKKDCAPGNLITLCGSCNSKANTDREWHEAWYSAIIKNRYYNTEAACYGT
jgi:hypothetical protein